MTARQESECEDEVVALAAMSFDPWTHAEGEWKPPTNLEWMALANPHLVSVRLAWLTLHKSKDELRALYLELGDNGLEQLVAQLGASSDWFKGLHEMLLGAECRIMCGAAAAEAERNTAS